MDQSQRHKRLRQLVSKLNKERKKQAQKTDMLCNDLIAAQRDFISRLSAISFAADFYKSIIGITDLDKLLFTAGKLIKDELTNAETSFFLRNTNSSAPSAGAGATPESDKPTASARKSLEDYFTTEVIENICKSNKICTLDEMFTMGLQGNLVELSKISAFAVPLSRTGLSLGFILIHRCSGNNLSAEELNKISAITCGLARAIQSCQALSHIED